MTTVIYTDAKKGELWILSITKSWLSLDPRVSKLIWGHSGVANHSHLFLEGCHSCKNLNSYEMLRKITY